ncbi:MAG TPA: GGDEF domain-containing protein, partial [Motiliproteus sp.]
WLTIDPIEVQRDFLGRVTVIVVSGMVKALLLSALLLALFYVTLTRPIQRYAGWIASIEPESPEHWALKPPERVQEDELAALGDAVSQRFREARHYFLQLQRTRNELKVVNAQLEERVLQRTRELSTALDRAETLASTDELTGIPNRRSFIQRAQQRHAEWQRHGKPYALVMLDIDHFKQINDRYGHPAGDQVLRAVAETLQRHTRREDTLGRLGGEEFCVLLVELTPSDALQQAERMRQELAALRVAVGEQRLAITASFGLACSQTGGDLDFDLLLSRADQALYQAKAGGRNRVALGN